MRLKTASSVRQLGSVIRLAQHRGGGDARRAFSVVSAVETTLATSQHLLSELHAVTGTPWWVVIPLVALSVNLVGRVPLTIYCRWVAQRRAELTPILRAWYARHAQDVRKEVIGLKQPASLGMPSPKVFAKETESRFKKTTKRIYKAFHVQEWKDYSSLAIFPLWLTAIESLRRLCGGPRGLLGSLVFGPKSVEAGPAGEAAGNAAAATSVDSSGTMLAVDGVSTTSKELLAVGADPSLATGGCLWFPDLMVADPLYILPFALSGILVANIMPKTELGIRSLLGLQGQQSTSDSDNKSTVTVVENKGRLRLQRALIAIALCVGPATMGLPAALHLYWISSAAITYTQTELIQRYMPMPKTTSPARGSETFLIRPPPPRTD
ncbi:hypothetical protein B0H63DRAFT_448534 [Podospora didyma]|uniref:Mitochondrial inner membrane protein COX18 n=1 Tax=Podospora didyma TaxID=330526 RepID=A0AAE0NUK3_9PEZI|nr:hypothetical protein B0H63DRAFT_448534 [Podospora didyma]